MDNMYVLLLAGFIVGTLGTLIGSGGGFILVPLLLLTHPELPPDVVTAVSMAIVAANAISGSVAYARSGRVDYKAGVLFALFTIPGSVLGVYATSHIPKMTFHIIFGILLIAMAMLLFFSGKNNSIVHKTNHAGTRLKLREITDKDGIVYTYSYSRYQGIFISLLIGFISPLLGIGGGIIHVPALINWLNFPIYIATATSHFILAVMSTVSVITHLFRGTYNDPVIIRMIVGLGIGAVGGAQLGAFLSHKIKGNIIIRSLAVCLAIAGVKMLFVSN